MDQGALHFRAVGESAEWDSGGIGGSLWSVTWHMASYPNPADKLCTWGSCKNWSLPQIRPINYHVWSLSLLKLALIYQIVKPAQVSHRARSWVGGSLRSPFLWSIIKYLSLTDFYFASAVPQYLQGRISVWTWTEVHHELTETNPRFQMPEGQYSTTNYCGDNPGAVEWYFWVTGCGSCWNPCFNNRNPQFLTLYTHITIYIYILCTVPWNL